MCWSAAFNNDICLLRHLSYCLFLLSLVHGAQKATKLMITSFVHGSDGLGNQDFPPSATKPVDQSAAAFLVEQPNLYPGQVTIVALSPLTNLALVCSPLLRVG
jgi:inosine-uridine nucleoside N-ribohydrolase